MDTPDGSRGSRRLNLFAGLSLVAVMGVLALNQALIKHTNEGFQPAFAAGLRSALAAVSVGAWMRLRGRPWGFNRGVALEGSLMGVVFAAQFLCLFFALDQTTVGRVSIIFYSMPVWLAVMSHVLLPGERMTLLKGAGLVLAFSGTVLALLDRGEAGSGASLQGDLLALGAAVGWAAQMVIARRPVMSAAGAEQQLLWMATVSAPLLLAMSPAFGPLIRDVQPIHVAELVVQGVLIVPGTFIAFLTLMSVYASTTVASFSFLTPIFALAIGRLALNEPLDLRIIGACLLVGAGILMINQGSPAPVRKP
jgi:drug/metabolite transporter (DMT)-like permease